VGYCAAWQRGLKVMCVQKISILLGGGWADDGCATLSGLTLLALTVLANFKSSSTLSRLRPYLSTAFAASIANGGTL
jgi:hypothetical protein